jgi:FkbM family methyltransferase
VTLLNVALSNKTDCASINIPYDKYNDLIYTRAELSDTRSNNSYAVLTFQYDDNLNFHHKIALVKIDVEGHEESVLLGMENLLMRDHPILIIETRSQSVRGKLTMLGYSSQILPNSPNIIFTV